MWKSCPSDPVPLLDVRTRVSITADTNLSEVRAPSETIANLCYSTSNSLSVGSPGNTGLCSIPYPKHLRGADWAYTLRGRAAVLHRYGLGVAHLLLGPALHTIRLQRTPPNLLQWSLSYRKSGRKSAIALGAV